MKQTKRSNADRAGSPSSSDEGEWQSVSKSSKSKNLSKSRNGAATTATTTSTSSSKPLRVQFAMEQAHIGVCLGVGGSTQKKITENTGAKIHIYTKEESGSVAPDRLIELTGSKAQVENAQKMIEELVYEHALYQWKRTQDRKGTGVSKVELDPPKMETVMKPVDENGKIIVTSHSQTERSTPSIDSTKIFQKSKLTAKLTSTPIHHIEFFEKIRSITSLPELSEFYTNTNPREFELPRNQCYLFAHFAWLVDRNKQLKGEFPAELLTMLITTIIKIKVRFKTEQITQIYYGSAQIFGHARPVLSEIDKAFGYIQFLKTIRKQHRLESFSIHSLCLLSWAVDVLNLQDPELFNYLEKFLSFQGNISLLTSADISCLSTAFLHSSSIRPIFNSIAKEIAIRGLVDFSSSEISNLACSFAFAKNPDIRIFDAVLDELETRSLSAFDPYDVVKITWAYANFDKLNSLFFDWLAINFDIEKIDPKYFEPQHASRFLFALAKSGKRSDDIVQLFKKIGSKMLEESDAGLLGDYQIALVVWSHVQMNIPISATAMNELSKEIEKRAAKKIDASALPKLVYAFSHFPDAISSSATKKIVDYAVAELENNPDFSILEMHILTIHTLYTGFVHSNVLEEERVPYVLNQLEGALKKLDDETANALDEEIALDFVWFLVKLKSNNMSLIRKFWRKDQKLTNLKFVEILPILCAKSPEMFGDYTTYIQTYASNETSLPDLIGFMYFQMNLNETIDTKSISMKIENVIDELNMLSPSEIVNLFHCLAHYGISETSTMEVYWSKIEVVPTFHEQFTIEQLSMVAWSINKIASSEDAIKVKMIMENIAESADTILMTNNQFSHEHLLRLFSSFMLADVCKHPSVLKLVHYVPEPVILQFTYQKTETLGEPIINIDIDSRFDFNDFCVN